MTVSVKVRAVVEFVAVKVFAKLSVYALAVAVSIDTPVFVPVMTKVFVPVPAAAVDPLRAVAIPCVVDTVEEGVEIVGKGLTTTVKVSRVVAPARSVEVIANE